MKRGKKPQWQKDIAKERIKILLSLARKQLDDHPERSKRYVGLARKISMRYNIRLEKSIKKSICKKCDSLLLSGKTSLNRFDFKKKTLNIICKNCGNIIRIPYKVKKDDGKRKH